jgi:nucleoside phosphorylase
MPPKPAGVLLVTVTKVESQAVLEVFQNATHQEAYPAERARRTYFDLGTVNNARIHLTQSEMGTGGLDGAMQTVLKGIDSLNPAAVIMVGIAFGVNETRQSIGDILVSENLRCYDLQRVGTADHPSR